MSGRIFLKRTLITDPGDRRIAEQLQAKYGSRVERTDEDLIVINTPRGLIPASTQDLARMCQPGVTGNESKFANSVRTLVAFNRRFEELLFNLQENHYVDQANLDRLYELARSDNFDFTLNFEGDLSPLNKILWFSHEDPNVHGGVSFNPILSSMHKQSEIQRYREIYAERYDIKYFFLSDLEDQISLKQLKEEFPQFKGSQIEAKHSALYTQQATAISKKLLEIAAAKGVLFNVPCSRDIGETTALYLTSNIEIVDWLINHNAHTRGIELGLEHQTAKSNSRGGVHKFITRVFALKNLEDFGLISDPAKKKFVDGIVFDLQSYFFAAFQSGDQKTADEMISFLVDESPFIPEAITLNLLNMAKEKGYKFRAATGCDYQGNLLFSLARSYYPIYCDYPGKWPTKVIKFLLDQDVNPFEVHPNRDEVFVDGEVQYDFGVVETKPVNDFVTEQIARSVIDPIKVAINNPRRCMEPNAFNCIVHCYNKLGKILGGEDDQGSFLDDNPQHREATGKVRDDMIETLRMFQAFARR